MPHRLLNVALIVLCLLTGEVLHCKRDLPAYAAIAFAANVLTAQATSPPAIATQCDTIPLQHYCKDSWKQSWREECIWLNRLVTFVSQAACFTIPSLRNYFSYSCEHVAPLLLCDRARHERTGVFLS